MISKQTKILVLRAILSVILFGSVRVVFAQTTRMLYTDSTGNNIGIGTTTPQAAFVVTNGNVGIGTWTADGGRLIVLGGNVGIGSTAPGAKLEVSSASLSRVAVFRNPASDWSVESNLLLTTGDPDQGQGSIAWLNRDSAAATPSQLQFRTIASNAEPTVKMVVTGSGNVGIGTTTPQAALVVTNGNVGIGTWTAGSRLAVASGDINTTAGNIVATNATQYAQSSANEGAPIRGISTYAGTDSNIAMFENTNASGCSGLHIYTAALNVIGLQSREPCVAGAVKNLVLQNAGGNVGIGTTGPGATLELRQTTGNNKFLSFTSPDVAHGMTTLAPTDTYGYMYKDFNTSGGLTIVGLSDADGSARAALQLRGVLGEAAATSGDEWAVEIWGEVKNGTGATDVAATGHLFGVRKNSGATVFGILGNGNVGIGATGPLAPLDVRGYISEYKVDTGDIPAVGAGVILSHYSLTNNNQTGSGIFSLRDNGDSNYHGLAFKIHNTATATDASIVAAVISSTGNVGIGTTNPLSILHVRSASGTAAHVRIDSGGASDEAQIGFYINGVLKWQQSQQTAGNIIWYDGSDNQILFRADASAQNDDGWETAAVDYAEWMKKLDSNEEILPFEVVGIKNGKVTKDTNDAAFYMLTSSKSGIRGGNPIDTPRDNDTEWVVVAYTGQVPVLLKGEFKEGDYVIPSGRNDGLAVAVPPENVQPDQYKQVIGRVLNEFNYEFSKTSDGGFEVELRNLMSRKGSNKIVNVAVGTSSGVTIFDKRYDEKIKKLEMENDQLQARLTILESKVK